MTNNSRLVSPKTQKSSRSDAITGMRKVISEKMLASIQTTAQFTLHFYADATKVRDLRKRLKNSSLELNDVTINDIMLYVTAKSLAEFAEINAHFSEGVLQHFDQVNLGFAVDVKDGLMVPVLKDADKMSLKQISKTAKSIANDCRQGSIKPQDMAGGTFTVSNLGSLEIEMFTPILNVPEVGILGIGGINPRTIRRNGVVEFVDMIALSLTVNHQVIDGAVGARFSKLLKKNIENVDILVVKYLS